MYKIFAGVILKMEHIDGIYQIVNFKKFENSNVT